MRRTSDDGRPTAPERPIQPWPWRRGSATLPVMYETNRATRHVRDRSPRYPGSWSADPEPFPAEGALHDLKSVTVSELPRVLARYAVLRYWLLSTEPAAPELLHHAREAAHAHLDCLEDGWREAGPLHAIVAAAEPVEAAGAVAATAAGAAEHTHHLHGAHATLRAAFVVARRRCDLAVAAAVARRLAAFADRHGDPHAATRWRRRAARLEAASARWLPPSRA